MEVLVKKLRSEVGIEWSTVRDESTSLGTISYQSLLEGLELVGILDPSGLVVGQRVDQSVGLVHFLTSLHGVLLEGVLLTHGVVVSLLQSLFQSSDFSELTLGSGKVGLSLLKLTLFDLKELELWLHDFRSLVVITHGSSPIAKTTQSGR